MLLSLQDFPSCTVTDDPADASAFSNHYVLGVPLLENNKIKWPKVSEFMESVWPKLKVSLLPWMVSTYIYALLAALDSQYYAAVAAGSPG